MSSYTSGDYDHLNNMIDDPEIHHIGFILNHRHDMYITSPLNIMEETCVSLPKQFVKKMIEPWMNANIQFFAELSKVNVWNQHNQQTEKNV